MRKCIIPIDVYDTDIHICKVDEAEKYAARYFNCEFEMEPKCLGCYVGFINEELGLFEHVLFLPKKLDLRVLVHECVHAAYRVLERHEVKVDADNQEPLAYLTDYLFAKVLDKFYKKPLK